MPFRDRNNNLWHAHCVLASYIADTPEQAVVTSTVLGHCPRCTVDKEDLNKPDYLGEKRDVKTFRDLWKRLRDAHRAGKAEGKKARSRVLDEFQEHHLHPVLSAVMDWPFSDVIGLDLYSIVRYEHMHTCPLGMFKHLLEFVVQRLSCGKAAFDHCNSPEPVITSNCSHFDPISGAFKRASGSVQKLHKRQTLILRTLNEYLKQIQNEAPATGFMINFTRQKLASELNALFTEHGCATMLEATHFDKVLQVMPFVAALADRLSEDMGDKAAEEPRPYLTEIFINYGLMIASMTKKDRADQSLTPTEIELVRERVRCFQETMMKNGVCVFHKTMFCLIKFHFLSHVHEDLAPFDPLLFFSAGPYETSHIVFKLAYKSGSGRLGTAFQETTAAITRETVTNMHLRGGFKATERDARVYSLVSGTTAVQDFRTVWKGKEKAAREDSPRLLESGKKFTMRDLRRIIAHREDKTLAAFLSRKGVDKLDTTTKAGRYVANANAFVRQIGRPGWLAAVVHSLIKQKTKAGLKKKRRSMEKCRRRI